MKFGLVALALLAFATEVSAQNPMGKSGDASKCTIAKCKETQKGRGYTDAQASNWCPKNLHKGCI